MAPRGSNREIGPGLGSATNSYVENGPLPSSEEWKERGAAVALRKEVDRNGTQTTRVVKKGVKDFNFGRTLGEGSYSTVCAIFAPGVIYSPNLVYRYWLQQIEPLLKNMP